MKQSRFEVEAEATEVYLGLQSAYQETLVGPLDDMYAAFADAACPYALLVDGEVVGFCAVSEDRELLSFHVHARFENLAEEFFSHLIERLELVAAIASTVDPGFLSLSLGAGSASVPVALMFQHVLEPEGRVFPNLRLASTADHPAAIAFNEAAIRAPRPFVEPYLAARIERGELFLYKKGGEIIAVGECRKDQRRSGYTHVGMIVGLDQRGRGLGTGILCAMVLESRRLNVKPLCSTDPENLAARRAIHKAGFRARHRMFRVALSASA